jgi:hypothetical protein
MHCNQRFNNTCDHRAMEKLAYPMSYSINSNHDHHPLPVQESDFRLCQEMIMLQPIGYAL